MKNVIISLLTFLVMLSFYFTVAEAQTCPEGTYEATDTRQVSTSTDDWYDAITRFLIPPGYCNGVSTASYSSTPTIPVYTYCFTVYNCGLQPNTAIGYLRFPVSIPPTAQVKSATLSLYDTSTSCKNININGTIFKAGTFQTGCRYQCQPIVYNYDWCLVNQINGYYFLEGCTAAAGAGWYTVNMTSTIQNVINQPGWVSGNRVVFGMSAATTEQSVSTSAYDSGSNPARLSLTYCTDCAGSVSLYLNASNVSSSAPVRPSATGMWGCGGKTVYFRQGSCSGPTVSNCTIANGECNGTSFTASVSSGTYAYYACIDKDGDNSFNSPGETDSATLTVGAPCQETYKLYPSDDAYVDVIYNTNINYGTSPYLYVGYNNAWRSYLKFNLAGAVPPGSTITNATLNLLASSGSVALSLSSTYDTWYENSINGNNAPGVDYQLATDTVSTTGWRNYSVTSFVNTQNSGDQKASFLLAQTPLYNSANVIFYSKEAAIYDCVEWDDEGNCINSVPIPQPQYRPYLNVSCAITFDFNVSTNPASGSVIRGNSITTNVIILNSTRQTQSVTLSPSNLPPGSTASFNPPSCTPPCSSTMTITTSSDTSYGLYPIKVTGTSGNLNRSTTFKLNVTPDDVPPTVTVEQERYQRNITITERSGKTLYDYPVSVTIDTSSLISQGKMRSNCGDIRVIDSDGNFLNYWVENCNSPTTRVWIRIPSLTPLSNKTVYINYGNSLLNSESSYVNSMNKSLAVYWDKSLGPTSAAAVDSQGNIIVVGQNIYVDDCSVRKYDSNGNFLWSKTLTFSQFAYPSVCTDIATDTASNVVVVGYGETGNPLYYRDGFIVKFDSNGNELWRTIWRGVVISGADYPDILNAVATDSSNNITVVGQDCYDLGSGQQCWGNIVKYNSTGGQVWFYITGYGEMNDVTIDSGNNIIATGYGPLAGQTQYYVRRLSPTGSLIFQNYYPSSYAAGSRVERDSVNNIITSGLICDATYSICNVNLTKFTSTGGILWYKNLGTVSLAVDRRDNSIIVSNGTYLTRYDSNGNFIRSASWSGSILAIDSSGNLIVTGVAKITETTSPEPTADIQAEQDLSDWTQSNSIALISCQDIGYGCDASSYRMNIVATNPGVCSTDYSKYSLLSPTLITDYGWVCGATRDLNNNYGFSLPKEFKIDRTPPTITVTTASAQVNEPVAITASISDQQSGFDLTNPNICKFYVKKGSDVDFGPANSMTVGSCDASNKACTATGTYTFSSVDRYNLKIECENRVNLIGTDTGDIRVVGCSGYVRLTISPTFASPSSVAVPSAFGLSDCDGKTVNFRKDSCSGQQLSSCAVIGSGCTGSTFSLPATSGSYEYFACIDINSDSDFADPGESSSLIYNVGYSSLPEFNWTGILQIIILAVMVLFIFIKKS